MIYLSIPFSYAEQRERNFTELLLAAEFTPTASFIWKSGYKLAGILLRKRTERLKA